MRAAVFTDAALAKQAGRFVWLSVDTEKPGSAPFQEKFPIEAWPTLLVIDPAREAVLLRWLGSANVQDLGGLLDDGARALNPAPADALGAALARADALEARGQHRESAEAYRGVLASAGPAWSDAPRVLQSLSFALTEAGALEECAHLARERVPALPPGPAAANLVATGLQCAADAPDTAAWKKPALEQLEPLAQAALKSPGLLADDRSGIYEVLTGLRAARHDDAGHRAMALEWLTFLEGEAKRAKSPEARAAFDPHRTEAAIAAGDPARALPALQQSERELPGDYNPPARQASVYLALGKLPEALAASDRALALVYGPRTLRVLDVRASILERLGRHAEARAALERAIQVGRALPKAQQSERQLKALDARLRTIKAP